MKLQSQLNIAFTTLLLVTLTVTGFVIYSMILDLLIEDEQRQLEQKGELLVNVLNEEYKTVYQFNDFLQEQDLQLLMFDRRQGKLLLSTMPTGVVEGFLSSPNHLEDKQALWEYKDDKYVTSRILLYPQSRGIELILLTPLNDLQAIQGNFIFRLLIVFLIGAIAAVVLIYFLTNKLVTPLTRLKGQLKKVEKRQFDDIERIKATGEIKEVEQSVYDMASELQRYITSQQTFFQNASHELKTPLMTIQGYAEGIRDHIFEEEDSDKGLEVIVNEVNRLKKIINEMILLAKLDSEQAVYQPERVDVSLLIDKVVARTVPIANEKGIEICKEIEPNIVLFVDEGKMLQALLNITVNAIRYSTNVVK